VHGDFLREDAPVPEERRPRVCPAVRVEAVDQGHSGPQHDVLDLCRDHPGADAPAPDCVERCAEGGSVGHVKS
jgi:hypothetical protein